MLIERQLLPAEPFAELAQLYLKLVETLPGAASPSRYDIMHMQDGFAPLLLERGFNRALFLWWPPRLSSPALRPRPAMEWTAIQERFYEGGTRLQLQGGACAAHNGVVIVDGLLSDDTLAELLRWCKESMMWFTSRAGYLGAMHYDAFNAPLLCCRSRRSCALRWVPSSPVSRSTRLGP